MEKGRKEEEIGEKGDEKGGVEKVVEAKGGEKGRKVEEKGKKDIDKRESENTKKPNPNEGKMFPIFINPSSGIKNNNRPPKKRAAKKQEKFIEKAAQHYFFKRKDQVCPEVKEDLGESSKKVKEVFIKMNMKCKNTIPVANDCDEVMIGSCVSGGEGEKERRGEGERGHLDRAFGE